MRQNFLSSLARGSWSLKRRTAKIFMTLLACSLAAPAVCLPPETTAPVIRPPNQLPQTMVQSAETKEVVVAGQSLGFYNVGALTPQPVILTSVATLTSAQLTFWSNWYRGAVQAGQTQTKDVIIIARSADGREVQRWTLQGARPIKFNYAIAAAGSALTASISLIYTSVATAL